MEVSISAKPANATVEAIREELNRYEGKGSIDAQDHIFMAYTGAVEKRLWEGDIREVLGMWENEIRPLVLEREKALGEPIHKGSPLYNTGIVCFVAGDFDSMLRYFVEADDEDVKIKNAEPFQVVLGEHPLSRKVLIDPLFATFSGKWGKEYVSITGCDFTEAEIRDVLLWLGKSRMDALQVLWALHRFRRSLECRENAASQHIRVRAIGEMLVALESTLKHLFAPTPKLLADLLSQALNGSQAGKSLLDLNQKFNSRYRPKSAERHSPEATDWLISEAKCRLKAASSRLERMGIACSLAQHLRNGLAHSIEESLEIFKNAQAAIEAAELVFCAFRIAKHCSDGTLKNL